jgi:hypothetical protein
VIKLGQWRLGREGKRPVARGRRAAVAGKGKPGAPPPCRLKYCTLPVRTSQRTQCASFRKPTKWIPYTETTLSHMLISHAPLCVSHSVPATDSQVSCEDTRNSDVTSSRACLPVMPSFALGAAVSRANFLLRMCVTSVARTQRMSQPLTERDTVQQQWK